MLVEGSVTNNNVSIGDSKGVQVGDGNTQVNNYIQSDCEALSNAVQKHPETYYDFLDLARFTGRGELIDQVNDFIATHRHGWVVIQGEAGVGKSALAAHLVCSNGWFYHFTWLPDGSNPENARKNLAGQVISTFGLENCAPGGYLPPEAAEPKFLADVLQDAAVQRDNAAPGQPIVLVIDTLADITPEIQVDTPLGIPSTEKLPYKVFVIVTRRPGSPLTSVGEPILPLPIELDEGREQAADSQLSSTNIRDMHEYLSKLLEEPGLDRELLEVLRRSDVSPGEFADTLVDRCAGVWIYLKYVLEDVRDGRREPTDVESLPYGLRNYYRRQIERQRKRNDGKWKTLRLPALATLAALRRPVTEDKLASLIGLSDAADATELSSWLDEDIRAFLHKDVSGDDPSYEIRHQSLRDLVTAPGAPGQARDPDDALSRELPKALHTAQVAITADLIPPGGDWTTADQYVRSTLAEHAAYAGRLDELVTDPGFLLICQPASVLLHRRDLKSPDGVRAISAYEAALNEWAQLQSDPSERAWRLHIWARKAGAAELAVACCAIAGRTPVIQAAMWTGTTHRAMHAHIGSVGTVAVLPMGEERPLLASGGSDGLVRLWDPDAAAAAPEGDPLVACEDWVTAAAAVPTTGGHLLATGAKDGSVWFWSPHDARPFAAPQPGHKGPVSAIAAVRLADDRTMLATAGRDGKIRLWDPAKRALDGDPLTVGTGWVTAAAPMPTPTGQLLVTGTDVGTVQLWDLSTRKPVGDPITTRSGPVQAIAAVGLANGRMVIATGGRNGVQIWFWDPQTRQPAGSPITHKSDSVSAITVARLANRTLFATAGQGRIRLWDADTGSTEPLSLPVHARWVKSIAAVPLPEAGIALATGGSDGRIELQELYESATGALASVPSGGHSGHNGHVTALAVTELGGRTVLASGSRDRSVRLWDPLSGDAIEDPLTGPMGPLRAIAAVPLADRNLIATSDTDGTMEVWDLTTSPPTCRSLDHYAQIYALAAVRLPDSTTLLAIGGDDGTLRLWDPVTGEPVAAPLACHGGQRINAIASARLMSGQTILVTGGSDGTVQLWDAMTRAASGDPLNWQVGRIRAVVAVPMPDGHTMFAAGGDAGVVQIWDGAGRGALVGPPAAARTTVNAITAVEFPDRTMLATGGDDGIVRLWDPVTGEPAARASSWAGHSGPVRALASVRLPGGPTLVASGGDDKTILIWTFG